MCFIENFQIKSMCIMYLYNVDEILVDSYLDPRKVHLHLDRTFADCMFRISNQSNVLGYPY